jgi:peptidoglycan/LPS O-acetylase OafA/YrhL
MKTKWIMPALRLAAVCALLALALMIWGVLDPAPIALVIAMSVGQAIGTLSFALYLLAVFVDLRSAGVFTGAGRKAPEDSASKPP